MLDLSAGAAKFMTTKIFVNLAVADLEKSKTFFAALGFTFNPQFTDETAACMVIADDIYAMLLTYVKFREFTRKDIADAHRTTEVMTCLSFDSKARVEEIADKALAAGGSDVREPMDTASCTVAASTTSTATSGSSSGWTRATFSKAEAPPPQRGVRQNVVGPALPSHLPAGHPTKPCRRRPGCCRCGSRRPGPMPGGARGSAPERRGKPPPASAWFSPGGASFHPVDDACRGSVFQGAFKDNI